MYKYIRKFSALLDSHGEGGQGSYTAVLNLDHGDTEGWRM